MKLIYTETGDEVKVGDVVTGHTGNKLKIKSFLEPHKSSSIGKVTVIFVGEGTEQFIFYVSVIGAEWIEREDRGWVAEKTITVSGWRGDNIEINKEKFVSQWSVHGKQFANLNYEFYLSIKEQIENVAAEEFENCYRKQNHKREFESKESRNGNL